MIVYQLRCGHGHGFEAWFKDSGSYDRQRKARKVECPICGDAKVSKAPMAPALARGDSRGDSQEIAAHEMSRKVMEVATKLRQHVEENCDYVGERFAEEARRIHYEEVDPRGIYGEASEEEAKELTDEGISFDRLPIPSRRND